MLTCKTTLIVPFHFRKSNEPSILNQDEPHTVTLARYWADRYLPILHDQNHKPIPPALKDMALWADVVKKLQELPAQESMNSKAVSEIRSWVIHQLSAEDLSRLGLSGNQLNAAFTSEANHQVCYVQKLWAPLNEVNPGTFNEDAPHAFAEQQEHIILKTRQLINSHKMTVGSNQDLIKFNGLNTRMGSSGMSASLKRLWCVDGVDEDEDPAAPSKLKQLLQKLSTNPQFEHPMAGRGLSLISHPNLLNLLSKNAEFKLLKKQNKKQMGIVKLTRVFSSFLSEQNGFLCFSFELLKGNKDKDLSLSDIQQMIYGLTRCRTEYLLEASQPRTWTDWDKKLIPNHLTDRPFNLNQLALWLISISNDHQSDDIKESRTGYLRRFIHHSSVYIDDTVCQNPATNHDDPVLESASDTLNPTEKLNLNTSREYTWRLARALGNERFAPLKVYQEQGRGGMQLYENVLIETSVEGSACLVWKPRRGGFNIKRWAEENYHGIYLILHLHARGEEAGLQDFSYKSLELIRELRPLTHRKRERGSLSAKIKKLKKLILEMVYFNLSFNSASAGGYSDHMAYLQEVREVYSLDNLREELKVNIAELGELVEREETADRDQEEQEFNRLISLFGTIVIPFGLFSGLYGMNNFSLEQVPLGLGFWGIIGVSVLTSIIAYAFIHRKKIIDYFRS